MQNRIAKILFSTRLTSVLFIVFATAMAVGTILDRNMDTSPTPYTRNMIYNAWWFEAIMIFFVINFMGNMFRYRLFRLEKWPVLILHLSWILIIIGAFITRYISFEGMMPIREGETEKVFYSDKTYLTAFIDGEINGSILGEMRIESGQLSSALTEIISLNALIPSKKIEINDLQGRLNWKSSIEFNQSNISWGDFLLAGMPIQQAAIQFDSNHNELRLSKNTKIFLVIC